MSHDPNRPTELPNTNDWNRSGWDMEDLDRFGGRARGHAGGPGSTGRAPAAPTPWLTVVTLISGLLVLAGGFNLAFTALTIVMGGPHTMMEGLKLVGELVFSGFITWAYYGVALHQHKARRRIMPFVMFKLCMIALGGLASAGLCFFSPIIGGLLLLFFGAIAGFFGFYLYTLQRLDVAAHFTH